MKNSGNTHAQILAAESHTGVNTRLMMTLGKAEAASAAAEK